jgi:hypothetical protein
VALSSLEAEYIGCSDATREAIWLRRLTMEIIGDQQPLKIYDDNQGALKLVKSGIVQAHTKHIDVKFHHIHDEMVNQKTVNFEYIYTSKNIADCLTKPLPIATHRRMLPLSGLLPERVVEEEELKC